MNGNLVIQTASAHGLSIGDLIRIDDGGITFTCATDSNASLHPYPRSTDPASNKVLTITAVTTNTFTVNVGTSSDTSTHAFHSAVANSIKKVNTRFNVVNAVYNGGPGVKDIHDETGLNAGEIVLTLDRAHNLSSGNTIMIVDNSLIFTCTMDNRATEHPYPRPTDPASRKTSGLNNGILGVTIRSTTKLLVQVGPSNSGGYFAPLEMELIASILENSTA